MTIALVVLAVLAFIFTIAAYWDVRERWSTQRGQSLAIFGCLLAVTIMLVFAAIWSATRPVPDYPPDQVVVEFCEGSARKARSFLHPRIQADPDLSARLLEWKEPLKKTLAGTYVPSSRQWERGTEVPISDVWLRDIDIVTLGIQFLERDRVLIRFAGTCDAIANEAGIDFHASNFSGEATLGRVEDRWWIEEVELNTNSEGELLW